MTSTCVSCRVTAGRTKLPAPVRRAPLPGLVCVRVPEDLRASSCLARRNARNVCVVTRPNSWIPDSVLLRANVAQRRKLKVEAASPQEDGRVLLGRAGERERERDVWGRGTPAEKRGTVASSLNGAVTCGYEREYFDLTLKR